MNWCNCDHGGSYDILSHIDENADDGRVKCYICGHRVSSDDVIILLLGEVKKLSKYIQDIEFDKMSKENSEFEENLRKEEEEKKSMERIIAESERFNILDL